MGIFASIFLAVSTFGTVLPSGEVDVALGPAIEADRPVVALFMATGTDSDPWLSLIRRYATAAAEDLGIKLEIHRSEVGRDDIRASFVNRVTNGRRLDYALFTNQQELALEHLDLFERHEVYSYLFNAGLTDSERTQVGAPGEKMKYWIGELTPNDEQAGYNLAKYLIADAKAAGHERIYIIGVTGSYGNPVAVSRVNGLKRAVYEDPQVTLLQTVSARWNPDVAEDKTRRLLSRYPDANVVWAANDGMALGALVAADQRADIVFGGMDWTSEARAALADGTLSVSMGGHFIDVAYALADIVRHHRCNSRGGGCMGSVKRSELSVLTASELYRLGWFVVSDDIYDVDFSALLEGESTSLGGDVISIRSFADKIKENTKNDLTVSQ